MECEPFSVSSAKQGHLGPWAQGAEWHRQRGEMGDDVSEAVRRRARLEVAEAGTRAPAGRADAHLSNARISSPHALPLEPPVESFQRHVFILECEALLPSVLCLHHLKL